MSLPAKVLAALRERRENLALRIAQGGAHGVSREELLDRLSEAQASVAEFDRRVYDWATEMGELEAFAALHGATLKVPAAPAVNERASAAQSIAQSIGGLSGYAMALGDATPVHPLCYLSDLMVVDDDESAISGYAAAVRAEQFAELREELKGAAPQWSPVHQRIAPLLADQPHPDSETIARLFRGGLSRSD